MMSARCCSSGCLGYRCSTYGVATGGAVPNAALLRTAGFDHQVFCLSRSITRGLTMHAAGRQLQDRINDQSSAEVYLENKE
jgi:hypothetical protein